ncbi:carboxypeptidase-like regulatory domain-containing protein [Polaribacter sp. Hel_I_88]|uniref:carboxypeptidase-like regulatory domain-containing protein n=1 Tax=Polaribacter sp. Hel_I_88 TaxID=1250006 RepID=UPI00047E0BDD|nr:carboxypeptidase-like regulatory domain-containing protein [Polaribacter sp. Hel_I_88]
MKKTFLLIVFLFVSVTNLIGQETSSKVRFKVVDKASKEPVVYATVMLANINRGTHADFNGFFEIPASYIANGIIKISSIGYLSKEIKLASVVKKNTTVIYLETANNALGEVVIKRTKKKKRALFAREIVRNAINSVQDNYPNDAHSYIGYYRDYQQPVDAMYQKMIKSETPIEYVNVHEAIIESFDHGFDSDKLNSKKNQSLLYEYRVNSNFIQDSTLTIPYDNKRNKYSESVYISPLGGNELNILNLTNAIRNYNKMSFSFVNTLNKNFIDNHYFEIEKDVFLDDTILYTISFTSRKDRTSFDYAAKGTLYIAKDNFAIHQLNYNLYYIKNKSPQYAVTIEYAEKNNKMYLNYITFNNFFEAKNGNYFKIDKALFDVNKNAFKIYFNRTVDINSLEPLRRNFKIYYKGSKLKIMNVSAFDTSNSVFSIAIDKESIAEINFDEESKNPNYRNFFTFDITNIKDINGFEIDQRTSIKMNQYREFFVQEVFEQKALPLQKNFINKREPLFKATITPLQLEENYWLNSPLKKEKE